MTLTALASPPEGSVQDNDTAIERLEDQIHWYDCKSINCQRWYKRLKTVTIVSASLIPVVAGFMNPRYSNLVVSALGGLVALVEGFQQLHQFHPNWIAYRCTCEALKHEKYLYLATAGPYGKAANPRTLLVERVESIVSQEHAKWSSTQNPATREDSEKGSVDSQNTHLTN